MKKHLLFSVCVIMLTSFIPHNTMEKECDKLCMIDRNTTTIRLNDLLIERREVIIDSLKHMP